MHTHTNAHTTLSDSSNCLHTSSTSSRHASGQSGGTIAIGGNKESGLGWTPPPLSPSNPQPPTTPRLLQSHSAQCVNRSNAILFSHFCETSRGGQAGSVDCCTARLGSGGGGVSGVEGGGVNEGKGQRWVCSTFTGEVNKKARGHKFNCVQLSRMRASARARTPNCEWTFAKTTLNYSSIHRRSLSSEVIEGAGVPPR